MGAEHRRLMVIGAHPDDPDVKAGGLAAKYARADHEVLFVSVTNGDAGHHEVGGAELARRRRNEARAAGDVVGIDYEVMENHDGELEPTLENRRRLVRRIRQFDPDLVLTHRPNDYHPDHRYTSILVQDSAYLLTVPNICPETSILEDEPVIAYLSDDFRKPYPFEADVVVAIDDAITEKVTMLHQHGSQVYEWLAYNRGYLDDVPESEQARRDWLHERVGTRFSDVADRFRDELVERYGERTGNDVEYAEAFEICEYGGPLVDEETADLFPP